MEYKVEIGGVSYGMDALYAANITQALFEKFSVGNACAAELTIRFAPGGTVPRMATIVPCARAAETEEWMQLGVFYTDTRRLTGGGLLEITAYDAMLKSEVVWTPDQDLTFPMTMPEAVDVIAGLMGVALDSRTVLNGAYTIDYPANDYTLRDVLRYIAAAHGGNWVITAEGKLRLVPLFGASETVHDVGKKVSSFEAYSAEGEIEGIELAVDDENAYYAGDQSGYTLTVECPYGTQTMADALLTALQGKTYYGYHADGAELAADAELGDGVTVNGVSSFLAYRSANFSAAHFSEIAAPGENEVDHEYPYVSQTQREIRRAASGYSEIRKSLREIALEVQGKTDEGDVNSLIQAGLEGIEISSSMDGVSGSNSCRIILKGKTGDIAFETTGVVQMGNVTADSISASKITAGTLNSTVINLDGELNVGVLDEDDDGNQIFTSYGYIGAAQGEDAGDNKTYGASLVSADGSQYVIVTNAGVRLQAGSNRVTVTSGAINLTTGNGNVYVNRVAVGQAVFG